MSGGGAHRNNSVNALKMEPSGSILFIGKYKKLILSEGPMIISNKILGLKIKYSTVSETEMIIKQLCNFNTWTSAIIEYGLRSILFYPTDTTVALSFLDEERIWCFRHDRHFCIMVMFENEEDLVLFKLQCLLDT